MTYFLHSIQFLINSKAINTSDKLEFKSANPLSNEFCVVAKWLNDNRSTYSLRGIIINGSFTDGS